MTKPRARRVKPRIVAKTYLVLWDAVAAGVHYGLHRSTKHVDHPTTEQTAECVIEAVMVELCERLDLGDDL